MNPVSIKSNSTRKRILINGTVQGVGFRPFVYRLADELKLTGHVNNGSNGVTIEVEGISTSVLKFLKRLPDEAPSLSRIDTLDSSDIQLCNDNIFVIRTSTRPDKATTGIPPDIAVCDQCLEDMNNPSDRRYRYPFTNCTNCGPRFTIVRSVPYDRPATSMASFEMCDDCKNEYNDPTDRRFHAQPVACPACGPTIWLHNGNKRLNVEDVISSARKSISNGQVLALRGLGGFHLAVNPFDEKAVRTLRERKRRIDRPFALMVRSIEAASRLCFVNDEEQQLLSDPRAPIVLLKRRPDTKLAESISIDNEYLGLMLPYTPLHHLLLRGKLDALVMTSGNLTDEPIAIDIDESLKRLAGIADLFLLHNREILQRCDDSIVTLFDNDRQIIRRSRGFVPEPVCHIKSHKTILGTGAELKNAPAIMRDNNIYLAQHIGDLDNPHALDFYKHAIEHLSTTLEVTPKIIACDMHPEYLSTKWATERNDCKVIPVQHHHAHMAALMVDNKTMSPIVALVMDGTGYGTDGTIWGGEILCGDYNSFKRVAWLSPIPMPGGEAAIKNPVRMAVGFLHDANIPFEQWPSLLNMNVNDLTVIKQAIEKQINCPQTSSCGRLFDAVAALLGVGENINYEAQAAIRLETLANSYNNKTNINELETLSNITNGPLPVAVLIKQIIEGLRQQRPKPELAYEIHLHVARMLTDRAMKEAKSRSITQIGLTGGVWQNRLLYSLTKDALEAKDFDVIVHRQVPCNDGGIALGQIAIAQALLNNDNS